MGDGASKERSTPKRELSSGEVRVSEARRHLPALTDEVDVSRTEQTESMSARSSWPPFASAPLPANIAARVETIRSSDGSWSRPLSSVRTVIGRGDNADIQLNDRRASRKHAAVFFTGTEFRIRDEGSANGTKLNGSNVVEYAIRDGDEVVMGDTVLRFRVTVVGA